MACLLRFLIQPLGPRRRGPSDRVTDTCADLITNPSAARDRLDAVAATLDGFELSRLDLAQRREGDVLGASQAGRKKSLKLLTLLADEELIGQARQEATAVVDGDPILASYPALAAAIAAMLDDEQAEFLEKA